MSQQKAPQHYISSESGPSYFYAAPQRLPASREAALTSDPAVKQIFPQKSFYEAAQCSYVNPVSLLRGLGNASLVWLAWLSLQGLMIDCKPH